MDCDLSVAPAWAGIDLPHGAPAQAQSLGRIHFVGIGGIGMSGIAEVLLTLGYKVSGSDLGHTEITERLAALGAAVSYGHDAAHVDDDVDVVVVSSAVDDANPEVRNARSLRIPVIPRAEMLAELMRVKCGVAVAGAHGKTTTTSLVAAVLAGAGVDPTVVIGGRLKSLGGTNARLGTSRYMVAEADESDGSFLLLKPTICVVTNIDREHMGYYGTMERLEDAYLSFINSTPFFGRAVLCFDDERVASLLPRIKKRFLSYGTSLHCDVAAVDVAHEGLATTFDVLHRGVALGRARVAMPGKHSALNALAAIAVGLEFGIPFERSVAALAAFEGIMRRFEIKGTAAGVTVVDDYGHHPTEIRATLAAARCCFDRRVLAVFQPHRYSRTADLFHEFTQAFGDADTVFVTDIYAAGERPIDGIDAAGLAAAIARRHGGEVCYEPAGERLAAAVASKASAGDVVLTLGAGDITRLGPKILEALGG
jgi:UDP-N-acetylmuramate--alanine ligase